MTPRAHKWPALLLALLLAWPLAAQAKEADGNKVVVARPASRQLTFNGFTRARAKLKLISEASGRVQKVYYDIGDTVGKKGVFVVLDSTFIKLELEANAVERARLSSRVAYLDKEAGRHRKLVARKSEPQSNLDRLEEELSQARLQLKALRTQRKVLTERLERHTIKAPAGWRVIERMVEPGQWMAAGTPVALLGDFRTLLVPLALGPAEYQLLKKAGQQVEVYLPHSGLKLTAEVERLSPAFDPATRKIKVELELGPGLADKRGGLRVQLKLQAPDPAGGVLLPAGAVSERYQEHWLTREGGKPVRVVLLGPGPDGTLRVSSPQVKPGQRFRLAR